MISISKIIELFVRVETPRYLDSKIQEIALSHLNLRDLGELRDKYDAQSYLNKLSDEIRSEFAIESFFDMGFDFVKRMDKNYPKMNYNIGEFDVQISYFTSKKKPIISNIKPTILIFLKPEKSAFIGPLIQLDHLNEIISSEIDLLTKTITINIDKIDFKKCFFFKNKDELIKSLNSKK